MSQLINGKLFDAKGQRAEDSTRRYPFLTGSLLMWFVRFQFLFFFLLTACSVQGSRSNKDGQVTNYVDCLLPKDQGEGSLMGQWASLPIPVILDRDFYVADEGAALPALRGAIQTWNDWAALKGLRGFEIQNDGTDNTAGMDIPAITSCQQAAYSSAVTDKVGIWKITSYGDGKNKRSDCGTQQKILPDGVQGQTDWTIVGGKIAGASILLNFEGFNSPGTRKIDVESLLLHELGHVLGLLHSCNGSSGDSTDSTSAPSCGVAPSAYKNAVMFPYLDVGLLRRSLLQNDYSRVNCLY